MKAIILKGIPGCGKSTLAKQLEERGYMVFNNDSVRSHFPNMKELEVKQLILDDIRMASYVGKDIVRDNTHINPETLKKCLEFLESLGYETKIGDVFADLVYLKGSPINALVECLDRNNKREGGSRVPNSVIIDMYLKDGYKLTDKEIILCDLDGTLYNMEHRLQYVSDWARFESNEEIAKDMIYPMVKEIIKFLEEKYFVVFLSGRRNTYEGVTINNLIRDGLSDDDDYPALLMRNNRDSRKDDVVKEEFYETISKNHKIVAAFDDRKMVCELWRKKGLYLFNCCQRESNDF